MRQHLLALAAVLVVVVDGTEDEAVAGVVDEVLVVGLRLQEGIARHLTLALDVDRTCVKEAVEADKLDEGRVGMLLNHLLDAVERGGDLTVAPLTG